jgi:hypothetical protein
VSCSDASPARRCCSRRRGCRFGRPIGRRAPICHSASGWRRQRQRRTMRQIDGRTLHDRPAASRRCAITSTRNPVGVAGRTSA